MSFKEIIGNQKSIEVLKNIFLRQKKSGVYLFWGPSGIGKRLIAKTLAKAINCLNKNNFDCCDECVNCKKIEDNTHPDVFFISPDPSGTIKIEKIRILKEMVYLKSYESEKRIFIIDDAHTLTSEAANACLKVLEEPTEYSLIILISAFPQRILPTILSRCYKLNFVPLEKNKLKEILILSLGLNQNLAHFLAYFTEGRIGRVIDLTKQQKDILRYKNEIIENFLSGRYLYNDKEIKKENLKETLGFLLSWFRDLYMAKTGFGFEELINIDLKEKIGLICRYYPLIEIEEMIDFIVEANLFLEKNINPRLLWSNLKIRARM